MYVSLFSTYVQTDSSKKTSSPKSNYEQNSSYVKNTKKSPQTQLTLLKNLPIDYISKNEGFASRLKAQNYNKDLEKSTKKYADSKTMQSAKSAYEYNSKISFISQKAEITLNQTPLYDSKLQETNVRLKMVNTYIQNDKYYQVTA